MAFKIVYGHNIEVTNSQRSKRIKCPAVAGKTYHSNNQIMSWRYFYSVSLTPDYYTLFALCKILAGNM